MNQLMRDLLDRESLAVLATCADNIPHCSLMAYIVEHQEHGAVALYLVTHRETKKFTNLQANSRVSLLIDARLRDGLAKREELHALTLEGVAETVDDISARSAILARFCQRHPHLRGFANSDAAVVIVVRVVTFQLQEGATKATYARPGEEA